MNQVSRPMQIALGAALVFALLWFVALRPKEPGIEPVAATPVTPAETPRADAGGAAAETALGKTIETAKNGAASADAAVKDREQLTGEETGSTPGTSGTPTTPASAAGAATKPAANAKPKADDEAKKLSASQKRANQVIKSIKSDLKARRAVVVLVWTKTGREDKLLHSRIKNSINRRGGKVRPYFISTTEVGRYDGLLGGLNLAQTPSTIVIAPSNEAKVLGGLTSTERINRLTSSALQTKPVATK